MKHNVFISMAATHQGMAMISRDRYLPATKNMKQYCKSSDENEKTEEDVQTRCSRLDQHVNGAASGTPLIGRVLRGRDQH